MSKIYRISEFAKRIGRSPSTVRRWETEGKIRAKRLASGHRYFLMSSGVKTRGRTRLTEVKPLLLMRRNLRPTKVRMKAPNGDSLRKKSL